MSSSAQAKEGHIFHSTPSSNGSGHLLSSGNTSLKRDRRRCCICAGKYTVPVLWDKQTKSIVNNESADIVRMFNDAFNGIAKKPEVDIYPEHLKKEIDSVNEWVYPTINNGVYRCGFATKQEPYEEAFL